MKLSYLINELSNRIAKAGDIDLDDVRVLELLRHMDTKAKPAKFDLIATLKTLEPAADTGAMISIPKLRQTATVPRQQLDGMLFQAARAGQVSLFRHDYPYSLEDDARHQLLYDGDAHYNAVAIRPR